MIHISMLLKRRMGDPLTGYAVIGVSTKRIIKLFISLHLILTQTSCQTYEKVDEIVVKPRERCSSRQVSKNLELF